MWVVDRHKVLADMEHRSPVGMENSDMWSTDGHRPFLSGTFAHDTVNNSQLPSTHGLRALTGMGHLWTQSVECSDHACGTPPHALLQYPLIENTTPRAGAHPPLSMEPVSNNPVLLLWLLIAADSTWILPRKESFQRCLITEGSWPIFIG